MGKRKVTWTKVATQQLNEIIKYIRLHSEQNADKVRERIIDKVNQLSDDSVVHRKDPYKNENDGNYLYFEIIKYRIVYYVTQKRFS